jgi:hypothetical protein
VTPAGDVDGDGVADWQIGDWLTAGPVTTPRVLPDARIATLDGTTLMHSIVGDVDGDGTSDILLGDFGAADADAAYHPSLLLGPFSGDQALARAPDASLPTYWSQGGLFPGVEGRMDALVDPDGDGMSFTLIPGPLANYAVGADATTFTVDVVNNTGDERCVVWVHPYVQSLGDLDGDGRIDRALFPFNGWSPLCPWDVGYLLPEALPAAVDIAQDGIAGWVSVTELNALPDQTGDGITDARVRIDGAWHLVAGPIDWSSGTLTWASDLGILPAEYAYASTVPDVTGDGMDDWIVGSWRGSTITDTWLRAGGVDEIFAGVHTNLRWWAGAQINLSRVDGDVLMFETVDGLVAVDLAAP